MACNNSARAFGVATTLAAALAFVGDGRADTNAVAPVRDGVSRIEVTLIGDNGGACVLDHAVAKAGPVTFTVTNRTATGVSEVELISNNRILGEKENLAPGLPAVSFTKTLSGGSYQIYCPGAKKDMASLRITGEAAPRPAGDASAILDSGAKDYKQYVDIVVDDMVTAVGRLKAAIDAGDLERAKFEYPRSRPFYERVESYVDLFVLPGFDATDNRGNLDYLIDMRASNLDPKVGWHGFHAIERDLYQRGRITDETKAMAAELHKNVGLLNKLVKTLDYKPEDLANGAADLLEEVQATKITGEEEAFSHYDLVDFANNVEGAQQAFVNLEPGMRKIDPDLAERVNARFARVRSLLKDYRDPNESGGYKLYTAQLKASDAAKLSKSIQALQEPLSKIAEKIAIAQ